MPSANQISGDDQDLEQRILAVLGSRAVRRLVDRGQIEITQGGAAVDPTTAKGAIRIRLPR